MTAPGYTGRARINLRGTLSAVTSLTRTSPSTDVEINYDPGDRELALDLLERIVSDLRAESASRPA